MRFWVRLTDERWFRHLSAIRPDEVNFWQPGSRRTFRAEKWSPFLFKLHSPRNYIVGGGFFVKYSTLPTSIAWEAFGAKNGAPDYNTFLSLIRRHRRDVERSEHNPEIGCIILAKPFFWDERLWLPVPENWGHGIQQGRTYETSDPTGASLWNSVRERIEARSDILVPSSERDIPIQAERTPAYGPGYLIYPRIGQGAFRVLVTDAYSRRCAVTGERTLPALEAAHIKPYTQSGPNQISNGLLLRSDIHKLFDLGYLTISTDLRLEVSRRIREEYENGRDYYALHGRHLAVVPASPNDRPSSSFLAWHRENVYLS
jgi:putative restriction endonuclease